MELDLVNLEFRRAAETWLRGLSDATLEDFSAVMTISPGYYPATLFSLWRQEVAHRGLAIDGNRHSKAPAICLPVTHPVDADWRFTRETTSTLLERAIATVRPGNRVIHLGAPSTFLGGCRFYQDFRHILIERSPATLTALDALRSDGGQIYALDIGDARIPSLEAEAAILDPPWYPAETIAFLQAASASCRLGAKILLCQPTPATRPEVMSERSAVESELDRLGLRLTSIENGCVRYATPHFEMMSLRAVSTELADLSNWRTGDLLSFAKVAEPAALLEINPYEADWVEVAFGPVRLKARFSGGDDLDALIPGDILGTVSRRDPIRAKVGLWTSGNRVYSLANVQPIVQLIAACHNDLMGQSFRWTSTQAHGRTAGVHATVVAKLFDILLVELQEHATRQECQ